jgi:hypothetical protein
VARGRHLLPAAARKARAASWRRRPRSRFRDRIGEERRR